MEKQIFVLNQDQKAILDSLRNTVRYYNNPTKPVEDDSWEILDISCATI